MSLEQTMMYMHGNGKTYNKHVNTAHVHAVHAQRFLYMVAETCKYHVYTVYIHDYDQEGIYTL
jgi:hypothetical protein